LYVSPLKALGNDIQRNLAEPLAEIAALAAERAGTADLDQLRSVLALMTEEVRAGSSIFGTAWAFHLALASATHNGVIEQLMSAVYVMIESVEQTLYDPSFDPTQELADHSRLLAIVAGGEADLARQAMRDHLQDVTFRLTAAESRSGPAGSNRSDDRARA
jgi:DNA-binding FadR family transcriptional regulator